MGERPGREADGFQRLGPTWRGEEQVFEPEKSTPPSSHKKGGIKGCLHGQSAGRDKSIRPTDQRKAVRITGWVWGEQNKSSHSSRGPRP